MSVEAIQIHATRLEVNAHALDGAYGAWLADESKWPEYTAANRAYCAKLQTSFENYQRAAWSRRQARASKSSMRMTPRCLA